MRLQLIVLTLVLAFWATRVFAGYSSTEWGMSKDQVEAEYPGGTKSLLAVGEGYTVAREIGGYYAIVAFNFIESKLIGVKIQYPMEFDPARIRQGQTFRPTTNAMAKTIFDSLLRDLTTKYGKPKQTIAGIESRVWTTSKDKIILAMTPAPGVSGHSITIIEYTPAPVAPKKSKKQGKWEQI